jgi:hemin uptake protein HemP
MDKPDTVAQRVPHTARPALPPHAGVVAALGACAAPAVPTATLPTAAAHPPVIDSQHLLGSASEVLIDHHGVLYRLKRTGQGKLILTK